MPMVDDIFSLEEHANESQRSTGHLSSSTTLVLKINTDTVFDVNFGIGGLGILIRDTNDLELFSVMIRVEQVASSLHTEVKAVLFGLGLACD